ncbi:MAG: hypothetical protein ACLSHG_02025 [Oscillospiraceae bacterium]
MGGIDFDVPVDMDYDDPGQDLASIHVQKGYQHLNGYHDHGRVPLPQHVCQRRYRPHRRAAPVA